MNASSGKNIARSFDAARRLVSVIDSATNVRTTYTYDAGGNRKHETVRAPDFSGTVGVARNVTYTYDGAGQMSSWSDATTGKSLSYTYDAAGNLGRVTGSDGVDHRYTYDAADRLTSITQGASTVLEAYTYDAAGNRRTFSNGTTTVTYTYDAANRVTLAKETAGASSSWVYDAVGNITSYKEAKADNTVIFTQTYTYTENNRTLASATKDERDADADNHSDSKTDNTLDKSGRLLTETLTDIVNDGKTTTFQHSYAADGRELTVTVIGGTSGTSGSSASTYDANDNLIRLDLGQNDNQDTAEFKRFIYNSDGQILRRFHDDGENDNTNTTTQYLYALGNPVGETGNDTSNNTVTVLDRENYDLVENIGQEFPAPSVTDYQVRLGDTLQSIAGQLYGNPSLWFVIADANGLTGDERLKEGTTLKIPNTVELGRLTAAAHAVYNATDIIGSTLPNLKAPPPDDSAKCAAIGAIIGLILLAIVGVIISIVTIGAAAPAVAAVVGAACGGGSRGHSRCPGRRCDRCRDCLRCFGLEPGDPGRCRTAEGVRLDAGPGRYGGGLHQRRRRGPGRTDLCRHPGRPGGQDRHGRCEHGARSDRGNLAPGDRQSRSPARQSAEHRIGGCRRRLRLRGGCRHARGKPAKRPQGCRCGGAGELPGQVAHYRYEVPQHGTQAAGRHEDRAHRAEGRFGAVTSR